ncbi:LytR C-terminal domain-containing protein [Arabiibacter massiliensis]|uniref:LytR C-terminal domain-containing protein n=1 Tax=Arabiibacter massiliensis TaxID=1870985 RepID=UPI0009BBAAC3|nr:LytR C-terminal domain-containing protein [Arabiibacter massiliensis]
MQRLESLAALAACVCLCAALAGCAQEPVVPEENPVPQEAAELHPDLKEAEPAKAPLHQGKDEITVLVLNGCGIEGAAEEAAGKIRALGFENVTVDNATSWNNPQNRVSYHHEEHRAEVDEVAALFDSLPPFDPYCYEDANSGGWSMDYDILVMVG